MILPQNWGYVNTEIISIFGDKASIQPCNWSMFQAWFWWTVPWGSTNAPGSFWDARQDAVWIDNRANWGSRDSGRWVPKGNGCIWDAQQRAKIPWHPDHGMFCSRCLDISCYITSSSQMKYRCLDILTKWRETKYSICIYCFRCYRRKFMVIFFHTEKAPERRDLKGIYKDVHSWRIIPLISH